MIKVFLLAGFSKGTIEDSKGAYFTLTPLPNI